MKMKENCKMEGGKLKMEGGKNSKMRFFFVFVFVFLNDYNLFWVYQNGNFLPGKNQEKWLCPPQKNFPVTPLFIGAST